MTYSVNTNIEYILDAYYYAILEPIHHLTIMPEEKYYLEILVKVMSAQHV